MTSQNKLFAQPINKGALLIRVLAGGGIAFILIALFLSGVDEPNPAWPKFWWIRPMVVVPLAGAVGGAFFYYMENIAKQGVAKVLAVIAGIIIYIIGLWMGTVLGLDGTLWN